jgi:hypothetical protein
MTRPRTILPLGRSGTAQLTLTHLFLTEPPFDAGGLPAVDLTAAADYFLTSDRAVCALGGDPSSCRLNNHMRVTEGAGLFSGAGGFLQNNGAITFNPWPDRLISRMHGRVCGDGLAG